MPHFQEVLDGERHIRQTTPDLSVIIPTYNRPDLLPRAIQSVLNQTHKNVEVIVVDDGSTERRPDILNYPRDHRITYVTIVHTGLPAKVVLHGVSLARAPWVAWLSDDDYWQSTVAEEHFKFVNSNPDYDATYPATYWESFPDESQYAHTSGFLYPYLLQECFMAPPIARRHLYMNCLNANPEILGVEDWDLAIRISKHTPIHSLLSAYVKRDTPDGLRLTLGTEHRLRSSIAMFTALNEPERVEAFKSQLFWEKRRFKLPFCLRWYRLKYYMKKVLATI